MKPTSRGINEVRDKINHYLALLKAEDPAVQDYVRENEDDAEFMVYVRAHAAIATGLIEGVEDAGRLHG